MSHFERPNLIVVFCIETDKNLYNKFQIENKFKSNDFFFTDYRIKIRRKKIGFLKIDFKLFYCLLFLSRYKFKYNFLFICYSDITGRDAKTDA